MNPAAPSPSDSSIAQAYQEARDGKFVHTNIVGLFALIDKRAREIDASAPAAAVGGPSFQERVAPWMQECFGPEIANDITERGDRFLEESLEKLQAHGYDPARIPTLVAYVYGRPVGDPYQETGGVMVTLAAYCLATGIDMHAAGETELARIWTKVEQIRAKQASKNGLHTPLPTATPAAPVGGFVVVPREPTDGMIEALCDVHTDAAQWPDDYDELAQAWRRNDARTAYAAMIAASHTAQPSAKDGVRVGENSVCRPATQEDEADIDAAAGLVKLTLRLPFDLHKAIEWYAFRRQCVIPAAIREILEQATTASGLVDGKDYEALYNDLILQVGNKYEGESRHDTAKRYLQRAEQSNTGPACEAAIGREEAKP